MADVPAAAAHGAGGRPVSYEFDFSGVPRGIHGYRWIFPCVIDGHSHWNVGAYTAEPLGSLLKEWLLELLAARGWTPRRLQGFPIHGYRPHAVVAAPHLFLVGDAAGVDPLMGEGISFALEYGRLAAVAAASAFRRADFSGAAYQQAVDGSWMGKKLRRLHLLTSLFYGRTWPLWFGLAEHSRRVRSLGLNWYNGVDGWDRCGVGDAVAALLFGRTTASRSKAPGREHDESNRAGRRGEAAS